MPRPGGISNFLRQLAGPKPRRNRMNRQPQNVNRDPAPMQPLEEREQFFGFGPGPGPEQGFNGYGIFGGPEPFMDTENIGANVGDNQPFDNEVRHTGYSIFD